MVWKECWVSIFLFENSMDEATCLEIEVGN